jgi:hypothetical protein
MENNLDDIVQQALERIRLFPSSDNGKTVYDWTPLDNMLFYKTVWDFTTQSWIVVRLEEMYGE